MAQSLARIPKYLASVCYHLCVRVYGQSALCVNSCFACVCVCTAALCVWLLCMCLLYVCVCVCGHRLLCVHVGVGEGGECTGHCVCRGVQEDSVCLCACTSSSVCVCVWDKLLCVGWVA